jgi:hypothetical protein
MARSAAPLGEYLAAIREEVCAHCPSRPTAGPPCAAHGRPCAVELCLPELIASIHEVPGNLFLEPYQESMRRHVCLRCPYPGPDACPCPVKALLALLVQAVARVDHRREGGGRASSGGPPAGGGRDGGP